MRKKIFALAAVGALTLSMAGCSSSSDTGADNGDTDAGAGKATITETTEGVIVASNFEPQTILIPSMVNEVNGGKILELTFEGLTYYDVDGNTEMAIADSVESTDGGKTWNVKLKEGKKFSDGSPVTADNFINAWNWGADPANAALSAYFFANIEGYPAAGQDAAAAKLALEEAEAEVEAAEDDEAKAAAEAAVEEAKAALEEAEKAAQEAAEYTGLTGLEKVSDTEFNIKLSTADPEFDKQIGYSAFYPLPAGFDESDDTVTAQGELPVSNGPYVLTQWDHNETMVLEPNPEYDGPIPAKNAGIWFKLYTDDAAAYNDLLANQLDVIDSIPGDAIATFKDDLGERAINQEGAIWQSFTIPYYLEHFGNDDEGRLRRQAISMAIDRQEICDAIFDGTRSPATDFVAAVIPGHSETIPGNEVVKFNPEKAKELWAQANAIKDWGDATFELGYNADSSAHKPWVEAVVNQIKNNLGINAEPKPYEMFAKLREDASNGTLTSAIRTGWQADYPSAYNFMAPLYAEGAGSNDARYASAEFEAALQKGLDAADEAARLAAYDEAQAVLMKDLPAIPLWGQNALGGYSENVENVVVNWKTVPVYQDITKKK